MHYLLNRELTEIYITHAIRHFAISMVGVFVPIFFLSKGVSLHHLFIYFLIQSITQIILYTFGSKFICKIGIKHAILVSQPLLITFFIIMNSIDVLRATIPDLYLGVMYGVLYAIAMFFYWFPFHLDMVKFTSKKNRGRQIGVLQAVAMFFGILGPLAGGLIITYLSYNVLFIITAVLLFMATIPLFLTKEVTFKAKFTIKEIYSNKRLRNKFIYLAEGARQVSALVVWPIFLYFIAIQVSSMGLLYSLTNLLLAVFSIFVGRLADRMNKNILMRIGAIFHGISLTTRTLVRSLVMIFSVQSIGAISFPLLQIPYSSIIYNEAKKQGETVFIINRQLFFNIGRIVNLSLAFILFMLTGHTQFSLFIAILFGSVCAIIMSFITEEQLDALLDK
jgi:MFS family permease